MKKIMIFLCSFTIALCSIAQNNSNITISTTGTSNLKIRFGGKQYSLQDRSVTFQNLQPGDYSLAIFQLRRNSIGVNEYAEVYNKTVTLVNQKHLEISVLRFGQVAFDESTIEPDNWSSGSFNPSPTQGTNTGYGAVTDEQFAMLKKTIFTSPFDDERLATGKIVLKNNMFTVAQIKDLCRGFTFDDRRLEFAKFAYDYCVDKGIYVTVQDVFVFPDSKTALLNYIKNK